MLKENVRKYISVIIPNYNGGATIGKCLEAALASAYENFEVIVVDDCSSDNSVEIIGKFPCRLVRLEEHAGAARARNAGALNSRGDILFFTDADCLLAPDTLSVAERMISERGHRAIVGGAYTQRPYDKDFFSTFQSVFVNYSEMKRLENPDYIASHAMAIDARTFRDSGGFPEAFLPILEDVEFSHRLRRSGCKMVMAPDIVVRHIFNFSMGKSLRNAFRKTKYWIVYSLKNRDLLADSGTASAELKVNGVVCLLNLLLLLCGLSAGAPAFFAAALALLAADLVVSRNLLAAFYRTGGLLFAIGATLYYTLLYPAAIWAGTGAGVAEYFMNSGSRKY